MVLEGLRTIWLNGTKEGTNNAECFGIYETHNSFKNICLISVRSIFNKKENVCSILLLLVSPFLYDVISSCSIAFTDSGHDLSASGKGASGRIGAAL